MSQQVSAIRIKLLLEKTGTYRRLEVPIDANFELLQNILLSLLPTAVKSLERIQYLDNEEDWIALDSDRDWNEAKLVYQENVVNERLLRLRVRYSENSKTEQTNTQSNSNTEQPSFDWRAKLKEQWQKMRDAHCSQQQPQQQSSSSSQQQSHFNPFASFCGPQSGSCNFSNLFNLWQNFISQQQQQPQQPNASHFNPFGTGAQPFNMMHMMNLGNQFLEEFKKKQANGELPDWKTLYEQYKDFIPPQWQSMAQEFIQQQANSSASSSSQQPQPSASTTSNAAPPQPSAPVTENNNSSFERELAVLQQMGFTNREYNIQLLQQFKGDLNQVVNHLFQ